MTVEPAGCFAGKSALVTGGAGLIGSNLARRLVALGAQVTVLDSFDSSTGANPFNLADIRERIQLIRADVRDTGTIRPFLERQDFLFNLAGLSGHVESMLDPLNDLEVNALAQVKLLEACREGSPQIRIVFAGTRQVYGRQENLPVSEARLPVPGDYNSVSKLAGEQYHLVCGRVYGLWTTSLRMTNVFGPGMRICDATQTFVGWWIRRLLEGKPIEVYGDGSQIRDLNYVDDVVDALLLSVTHPAARGQIFNLGADPISLNELAKLMVEIFGSGSYRLRDWPEERIRIDIGSYYADDHKIRNLLGWQPQISLRDGLFRTLDYYRNFSSHYLHQSNP